MNGIKTNTKKTDWGQQNKVFTEKYNAEYQKTMNDIIEKLKVLENEKNINSNTNCICVNCLVVNKLIE